MWTSWNVSIFSTLILSILKMYLFFLSALCGIFFAAQVAVSSAADVRGRVPGNEGEPDRAAEPTDGQGHRVVPQAVG